jgi:hypothetical protein
MERAVEDFPFSFQFFREREEREERRNAEEVLDGMLFASLSHPRSDAALILVSEAPWIGGDDAVK